MLSRVSPFRHLRLVGYLLLPAAFRSLSRLSSALSAKASTLCSYQLNQLFECIALHSCLLQSFFLLPSISSDILASDVLFIFVVFLLDVSDFSQYSVFKVQSSRKRMRRMECLHSGRCILFLVSCVCTRACDFATSCIVHTALYSFLRGFSSTMETERFELLTPCLQGRCSPN